MKYEQLIVLRKHKDMSNQRFIFVIDTDQYSGNFEREMCAYLTGHVGDCGNGGEYAEMFKKEYGEDQERSPFYEKIEQRPDEHGCHRPCSIYETPDRWNDGMGNVYSDDDDQKVVIENYRKSWQERSEQYPDEKDARVKASSGIPGKFAACESVAIFFYNQPSDEQIEIMKKRAMEFPKIYGEIKYGSPEIPNILGFRLISETTKTEQETLIL